MCNTYYKEPVLELNLKNKESVKIINLHTLLTFCRHDDDNQDKSSKKLNRTHCRHAGTPFVLHVAADRQFPTTFHQKAASASPNSCTELRGNFTGGSRSFLRVWSISASRHLHDPRLWSNRNHLTHPFENNSLTFHFHVHKSFTGFITFTVSSWSKTVCPWRQNSGTERERKKKTTFTPSSHVLHLNKDLQYFKLIRQQTCWSKFTFRRQHIETSTFTCHVRTYIQILECIQQFAQTKTKYIKTH